MRSFSQSENCDSDGLSVENEMMGTERSLRINLQYALENKALESSDRQKQHHAVYCQKPIGGGGNRTQPCKSLQNKDLGQSLESGGTKSGTAYEVPENEQLSAVVSAWSSLPLNIRTAILLLVQQHVQ